MSNYGQHRVEALETNFRGVIAALTLTLLFASVIAASPAAIAQNTTVYAITNAQTGPFGTLNLGSGSFHPLGNSGPLLAGLGAFGDGVYGGAYQGDTLYRVNLASGGLTEVGACSVDYAGFGSTTSSLYGIDFASNGRNLYSVNAGTGQCTPIGSIGGPVCWEALSSGGSTLYLTCDAGSGSVLYSVNTSNAMATMIGNTGVTDISSLTVVAGVLYADSHEGELYTINTTTGQATPIAITGADLSGMTLTVPNVSGYVLVQGLPLAGTGVALTQPTAPGPQLTTTDSTGYYQFQSIISGEPFTLLVHGPADPGKPDPANSSDGKATEHQP